ncbi:MAG TPA: hypothetical protein VG797_03405 [Phycisphaerales bacterium]|nr:hypothetical protein [Phycisphaerales bacterium]
MNLPESAVVIDASSSSERGSPAIGAFAVAALCDRGLLTQRIDLRRMPRAALFDGYSSDRLKAAGEAAKHADFVVLAVDAEDPESVGLVKAFAARLPEGAFARRTVLVILGVNGLAQADAAARVVRTALAPSGAAEIDVAVIDRSRDGHDLDLEAMLGTRLTTVLSQSEAELMYLGSRGDRAA